MAPAPAAGAYGGIATSERVSGLARGVTAQVSAQAQELKRSVINGSVELSTLGSIGAVLTVVVSVTNFLGNFVKLSPARALLMVYCFAGALALLVLEGIHTPPPFVPESVVVRLRCWKHRLRSEAHILTTLTGRALLYVFVGSLLLADSGSWLGALAGFYMLFVGSAMLYVSRSAVVKLRDLLPGASERELLAKFEAHDADHDGKLASAELAALCADCGAQLTPRELESALLILDTDGSGLIDRDEFLAWWKGDNWQRNMYALV